MVNLLLEKGVIVVSTLRHESIQVGDLGAVVDPLPDQKKRVRVAFAAAGCTAVLHSSHFNATKFSKNQFVCWNSNNDIGLITGVGETAHSRRHVTVDIGSGLVVHLLLGNISKAPAVFSHKGDTVYSAVYHAPYFRKGDKGTLVGPGGAEKDRVAVLLDTFLSAFKLQANMVSLTPPIVELDSVLSLRTEDLTLISHTHGRQRRAERNILRKELQAAIKYGTKEKANPGRDGSLRWRYTYDGVVYITDESSRHEVTSWRIDDKDEDAVAPAEIDLAGIECHAVLIVDNSGSMRASDVPGYTTRARAVYDCLIRDFVQDQVKSGAAKDVVVTLISMGDTASVLIDKKPLNNYLVADLEKIKERMPRSHGNYIPALDKAIEVMTADAPNRSSLLLLLFSDGAPSDQASMKCEHGINVFGVDRRQDPLMQHKTVGSAWACRKRLCDKVKTECLDRIKRIGQVFGLDKVILRTVAFGPPKEDFRMLEEMANALPHGECQKLGLSAKGLKTAFSSLSSSMTELRTEGGGRVLTPRSDKVVDKQQMVDVTGDYVYGRDGWLIYSFQDFLGKYVFDSNAKELKKRHTAPEVTGLAFMGQPFAEGAERFVYRCTELSIPAEYARHWYDIGIQESMRAFRQGLRLVAKEAKDVENLERGLKFHSTFARVQSDAAALADDFTKRLPLGHPEWNVTFLQTVIYGCFDDSYKDGQAWVLVEPELDGKFTKWNNNAGAVVRGQTCGKSNGGPSSAGGITLGIGSLVLEENEDEEEDDDDEENEAPIDSADVPQAFSHFTYEHTKGRQLVCDLQGVWNPDDGFQLTDPVVHYVCPEGKRHTNGATDKGFEGVKRFFGTHVCGPLCRKMGLTSRSPEDIIFVPSLEHPKKKR